MAKAMHLSLVDIDSRHWPMFSAPDELARLLAEVADALPLRSRFTRGGDKGDSYVTALAASSHGRPGRS
jgi:hypothetical protein